MPYSAVQVHGLHFMVRLLKNLIYKVVGPLTKCKLNVDQEDWACGKKWMCWFFFIMLKKDNFEKKNSSSIVLFFSLGLHLSFIYCYMCWRCGLQIFSHQFLQKQMSEFDLYMFNVIYMWLVFCVITTLNRRFSLWLYLMLFRPYLAHH